MIWDYSNFEVPDNSNFTILHSDSRWEELEKFISKGKTEYEKEFDFDLVAILDSINTSTLDDIFKRVEMEKKWLKIYFENCNNYPKYSDNLNHFLYGSTCQSHEIIEMVKNEIEDR